MSVLDSLIDQNAWYSFLNYKEQRNLTKKEYEELKQYIDEKKYLPISSKIVAGDYSFSIPMKKKINKNASGQKRVVYSFSKEETIILKMIHYLLGEYDFLFAPNCYSFRQKIGPKQAFWKVVHTTLGYGYKVDIHNYFNSISVPKLLQMLKEKVDEKCYLFFEKLLEDKRVLYQGEILEEEKGVMAGTPISCFLSNLYLSELDWKMIDVCYARYADDILLFLPTKQELLKKVEEIRSTFKDLNLEINEKKEYFIDKGEPFEFLGFFYSSCGINLSPHSKQKMKAKIRRKARALRRWMLRKNVPSEKAMKALNNIFNYKFFYERPGKELNWSIWYFPVLTVSSGLKEIDSYFQQQLRYLKTGRYSKTDKSKVPYQLLKSTGYRSLVHEYYEFTKEKV